MKNKFKKISSPDFNKIQQTLAAEWLERAKEEKPTSTLPGKDDSSHSRTPGICD